MSPLTYDAAAHVDDGKVALVPAVVQLVVTPVLVGLPVTAAHRVLEFGAIVVALAHSLLSAVRHTLGEVLAHDRQARMEAWEREKCMVVILYDKGKVQMLSY